VVPAADPQRPEATRLGSYEILRKLARGGMAELFLARTNGPEGFEKLVVLKKILPTFAENPKFVRLFLDEAKLAATLDHPHIAHVYDMGKVEGNYFFTMEYVHGQDVRAMLRRTVRQEQLFPLDHTVQIVHAIASALHYAHERRKPDGSLLDIVHRDVSPSNILVSYDGAIKLVDFGVAKAATSSVKTRTGTLKGKIAYMSPEQAKGGAVDRRSDVFSLGIVLWELLTTQRLFRTDNDLATIQLIINSKPPPPRTLRPECPVELERIVLKALAADPEQRYQSAEDLQLDLEEFAREAKLKQSTIAFKVFMHELFADEICAWKSAQASGMTLTDHVVSASVVEMTTPVSGSEMSLLSGEDEPPDDDEEDDEGSRLLPMHGVITETRARNTFTPAVAEVSPKVMLDRVDHTPSPQHASPVAPIVITGSGAVRVLDGLATHSIQTGPPMGMPGVPQSGPHRLPPSTPLGTLSGNTPPIGSLPSSNGIIGQQHDGGDSAPPSQFPIAPREWRGAPKQVGYDTAREPARKRLLLFGLVGMALVSLIALSTGGSPAQPSIGANVVEPPVEMKSETKAVEMKVEPPTAAPATGSDAVAAPATGSATPTAVQPKVPVTPPKVTTPPKVGVTPPKTTVPSDSHHHATPPVKKVDKPGPTPDPSGFLPPSK